MIWMETLRTSDIFLHFVIIITIDLDVFFVEGKVERFPISVSLELVTFSYCDIYFRYLMHWSTSFAVQIYLQRHYGMVVGFCGSCSHIVRLNLMAIILNC